MLLSQGDNYGIVKHISEIVYFFGGGGGGAVANSKAMNMCCTINKERSDVAPYVLKEQ